MPCDVFLGVRFFVSFVPFRGDFLGRLLLGQTVQRPKAQH